MRKLPCYYHNAPALLPPPSPAPSPSLIFPDEFFSSSYVPDGKGAFDFATISLIAALFLLSLLAFSFIFYMRLRSRRSHHLENFNYLWTVRLLLVTSISVWAINEFLRLPFVRRKYLYHFLPYITLTEQANLCKLHIVLSLGLLEPSFLITLLFLVNVSIKKSKPSRLWALVSLLMVCTPFTMLQIFFVYISPLEEILPKFMHESSVIQNDSFGHKTALCTYPFFSCVVFGVFTVAYSIAFLMSCWRVMAFVINKGIRHRINFLATAVMVALSVQIVCFSLSWLWTPKDAAYGFVVLAMFLFVMGSMVVAEAILVIKPIMEALAAGADTRRMAAAEEPEGSPIL